MQRLFNTSTTIDEIKKFWDENPLYFGEYSGEIGTIDYFAQHEKIVIEDCMGGSLDNRFFNFLEPQKKILDVGCGPGFWVRQFCKRGLDVFAVDISTTAVKLTTTSLLLYKLKANVQEGNAEELPYPDESFDFINCQGVIHHTPNTEKCLFEFNRVLKPGGIICFSVYHKNIFLKNASLLRIIARISGKIIKPTGRGRENIFKYIEPDEIVRLYDGESNPLGKAFTINEIKKMIGLNQLIFIKKWHSLFPARFLPVKIPKFLHRILSDYFGLIVVFLVQKPVK